MDTKAINQTLATLNFKMKSDELTISADYTLMRKKTTNSLGNIECIVPAFDLIFEAKSIEEARVKSIAMVKLFFRHYLSDNTNKKRLNQLMISLTRFGFRAQDKVMFDLLHNKPVTGKLDMKQRDIAHYENYSPIEQSVELNLA